MPLVRFEVRNEYGLSDPELYRRPPNTIEDPKSAFDRLAVAGLVGILRQLGDLAEFAADVFHDLHEQVTNTGARAQKISSQIQQIESALPSLEKAVHNQRSRIHFAYISGCDWHANVRTVQSQLICSDLPQYMLDSYEECCDPPRLYLLDKFDSAGAGACLKRYSDPSYFRRVMTSSIPIKSERVKRKRKKKGSRLRSREIEEVFTPRESSSTLFASPDTTGQLGSVDNISMTDMRSKSEVERDSTYSDSEARVNFQIADTPSTVYNELECNGSSASTTNVGHSDALVHVLHNEPVEETADDDSQHESLQEQSVPSSCSVTWDEKIEIVKRTSPVMCDGALLDRDQDAESLPLNFESSKLDCENAKLEKSNQEYIEFDMENIPVSLPRVNHFDEVSSGTEKYMDANNTLESEKEKDGEFINERESNFNYADSESELSELKERAVSSLDCIDAQDSEMVTGGEFLNKQELSLLNVSYADSKSELSELKDRTVSSLDCNGAQYSEIEASGEFLNKRESSFLNFSSADLISEFSELKERTVSSLDCIDAQDSEIEAGGEFLNKPESSLLNFSSADLISELSELKERTVSSLDCIDTQDSEIEMGGEFLDTRESSLLNFSYTYSKSELGELKKKTVSCVDCIDSQASEVETDGEFLNNRELKALSNFGYADSKTELSELKEGTFSSIDCMDAQASEIEKDGDCLNNRKLISLSNFTHADSKSEFSELKERIVCSIDCIDAQASEAVTDGEFLNKRELKSLASISYADSESKLSEPKERPVSSLACIDVQATAASCSSTNDYIPSRLSNIVPSDGFDHNDQLMSSTEFIPKRDSSVKSGNSGSHMSNVSGVSGSEGLVADLSQELSTASGQVELVENTKAKIVQDQVPPAASLQMPPFSCWTNGGMLGLEPSKPPDFSILNGRSVANPKTLVYGEIMTPPHNISVKQNSQQSFRGLSLGELHRNREVSTEITHANDHGPLQKETNVTALGSILPGSTNIESQANAFEHSISKSISDLAHRFLANSLQRRISVNPVDAPTPSKMANADFRKSQGISLQNQCQGVQNGVISHAPDKEKMEVGSSVKSVYTSSPNPGSSSPPLEHMNISFYPMDVLQTSKLKLEFSSGNLHDCIGDQTFHAFQLIPGPSIVLPDSVSESDDDTFCRSSYSSQDLPSPRSESNSEMWGEDERSVSQKHDIADNSRGISSLITSICSSFEFEKMDGCKIENLEDGSGMVAFDSEPITELPGIDSVIIQKKQQEGICDPFSVVPIDSKSLSSSEFPSSSLSPPLPPMQWRVVRTSSLLEGKNSAEAEVDNHLNAYTPSSVTLQKKDQHSLGSPCNTEVVSHSSTKRQNLIGLREHNHNFNSKETNEREDLLQQIRTQAFNLRRTVIEPPSQTSASATNGNVVGILKKADVIHQAFNSSNKGRDDDNWSEG